VRPKGFGSFGKGAKPAFGSQRNFLLSDEQKSSGSNVAELVAADQLVEKSKDRPQAARQLESLLDKPTLPADCGELTAALKDAEWTLVAEVAGEELLARARERLDEALRAQALSDNLTAAGGFTCKTGSLAGFRCPLRVDCEALEAALTEAQAVTLSEDSLQEHRSSEIARARLWLGQAHAAQRLAGDGMECTFWFLRAAVIRENDRMVSLPALQQLLDEHPEWLEQRTLSLQSACRREFSAEILVVSHRWELPEAPDPEGVQLALLRSHLQTRPEIKLVWFDFACMTQGPQRTPDEQREFRAMLPNISLLFIGASCLLLVDMSYVSRFWTQYEARNRHVGRSR
jgi:hypothetical protein